MNPSSRRAVWGVAVVIGLGVALRLAYIVVPQGLAHDEAATLIFASCDWSSYQEMIDTQRPPIGQKTTVGEWRAYVEGGGRVCLGDIFRDELSTDVHPPLYHAALNLWRASFGDELLTARSLNLVLDLMAAAIFFLIAAAWLGRPWALAASLLYLVAPASFSLVSEIRPYALLGLLNVTTLWAAQKIMDGENGWRRWTVFGLASVAGMYTHYLFALVAVPATLVLFAAFARRRNRPQMLRGSVTALAQIALTLPLVVALWRYQIGIATDIGWSGEWLVGKNPLAAMTWTFVSPVAGAFRGLIFDLPSAVNLILAAAMVVICTYGLSRPSNREVGWLMTVVFWATALGHVGLYAVGALPTHAIGAKYQVLAVPFILLGLINVSRSLHSRWMRVACVGGLAGVMLIGSVRLVLRDWGVRGERISARTVAGLVPPADLVVLDTDSPGLVPPIVESWPRQQPILVGPQEVLGRPGGIADAVRGSESVVYLSTLQFGNSEEGRMRVLTRLLEAFGEAGTGVAVDSLGTLGCIGCGTGYQLFFLRAESTPGAR